MTLQGSVSIVSIESRPGSIVYLSYLKEQHKSKEKYVKPKHVPEMREKNQCCSIL